jgi:anti-anti-sigma factor
MKYVDALNKMIAKYVCEPLDEVTKVVIDERVVNGVTVLSLKGKLTLEEGELLQDKIDSLIGQGMKELTLNREGVYYFDSAGLGALFRAYATLGQRGVKPWFMLSRRIQDWLDRNHIPPIYFVPPPDD